MSEREFLKVFAKRLRYYLDKNSMTQRELAARLGVGTTSVYNWLNEIKSPRMDKVDQMCEIFHCRRSDLISDDESPQFYLGPEVVSIAQEIFENPDLHALFDAARNSTPDDLRTAADILKRFKDTNPEG